MTQITAVARLRSKTEAAAGGYSVLAFDAAPNDERNKAWSKYTPSLSISMNVLNSVASQFELDANYTLTFEKQEPWHG